jgi:sugar phosphate isomerase/epimerase
MLPTRRSFLHGTLAAGLTASAASSLWGIDPIMRNGKSHLRLSIAAYSFRDYFSGKFKPQMTMNDFADFAAEHGLDAVEPTSYYFKPTPEFLGSFKARCTRLGLDISGGAVGNNFCHLDAARLKQEIASVKQWIEAYSVLGAKAIRIFAGSVAKGDTEEAARARCVAAIHEACDHAARFGIYLALENHGGITARADQLLAIVQAVKHDCFGVNLDTGNFRTDDPYADLAKLAPYAVNVQVKTEIQRAGQKKEEADLKRLIDMLRAVQYRGYVALEYEAAEEPLKAIPRYLQQLRKLMG